MENDRNGTANEGKEEGRQWDRDNDSDRSKTRGEGAKLEGERVEQGEGGGQMQRKGQFGKDMRWMQNREKEGKETEVKGEA